MTFHLQVELSCSCLKANLVSTRPPSSKYQTYEAYWTVVCDIKSITILKYRCNHCLFPLCRTSRLLQGLIEYAGQEWDKSLPTVMNDDWMNGITASRFV